jgi:moderate conductance mechanosensitive channel
VLIIAGVLQSLGLNRIALAVGGTISLVALGIASAAAGNLGDIIAGVFLASDPDFGTGFTITSKEITGTIERIDLRKTRIRAADGKLHIVPNKMIESEIWIVEGRPTAPPPLIQMPRRRSSAEPPAQ